MSYAGPRGVVPGNPGRSQFRFSEAQLNNIQRSTFDRSHGTKTTFNEGFLVPVYVDEVIPGDTFNMRMTAMCRMTTPEFPTFDRSHGTKTTFNEGFLVPVYVDEVIPGDTFNMRMTAMCRMTTPEFPLFDNLYLETFWFFVPSRILWDNWERFNGAQDNPTDSTSFIMPTLTAPVGGVAVGDLADYFGLPIGIANFPQVQCLPFRAYNKLWFDWFKDENLQTSPVISTGDGPDAYSNYVLLRRGKRKDYFTSALPWTQKINDGTVVSVGLAGTAPVLGNGKTLGLYAGGASCGLYTNGATTFQAATGDFNQNVGTSATGTTSIVANTRAGVVTSGESGLIANLAAASGISINALRQGVQLQRLFEKDARGGTRYVEILWSHFGVRSPDYRLQRSELLGTGYSPVNIHPVPQTSSTGTTGATTPQGNLAAFATASVHGHGFRKSFTEHGYVIGLVSVRADLSYQQGVDRMWSRSTRYDFYWPSLAHIGEQAILNKEIYLSTNNTQNNNVFGYTGRYNEYRYKPSMITGQFRSTAANTLDSWHLAQNFGSLPILGNTFIVENAPMDRILAVSNVPHFMIDCQFNLRCARPMSVDAIPGFMDHF
ncbi:MAG: capsid protein [Microviridae sp.]